MSDACLWSPVGIDDIAVVADVAAVGIHACTLG